MNHLPSRLFTWNFKTYFLWRLWNENLECHLSHFAWHFKSLVLVQTGLCQQFRPQGQIRAYIACQSSSNIYTRCNHYKLWGVGMKGSVYSVFFSLSVILWFCHSDFISTQYLENELHRIRLNFAYALTLTISLLGLLRVSCHKFTCFGLWLSSKFHFCSLSCESIDGFDEIVHMQWS